MLSRHPDSARGNDLYETPDVATLALVLAEPLPRTSWEPACGLGPTVRVLRDAGHRVIATDLIDCIVTSRRQGGTMSALRRRLMQKLADHVDRVTQADRLFFERFPHRQHRIRLASQAEIARQELINGRPMTIPPGYRMFMVVRNIAKPNLEGAEADLDEATAREIFEWVSEPYRERRRCAGLRGVRP